MTKYIDVNCDKVWNVAKYCLWFFVSGIFVLGIIAQVSTLESYTSGTNDEGAYNGSSCMIGFFSGEKYCSKYGEAFYSWDWNSQQDTESFLYMSIILLIAVQLLVLFCYNLEREWIVLRCR